MKDFFRSKKKFLLVVMLMVVTLTGCSVPRGQNGKTYVKNFKRSIRIIRQMI